MSDKLLPERLLAERRGGPQVIPHPPRWRVVPGIEWNRPDRIAVADVLSALALRASPPVQPVGYGSTVGAAAVLCALFDEEGQAHVVLTRRSSLLRSHTHQVSFPGGRIDPGERPEAAALREAREEVGLDEAAVEIVGRLSSMVTLANPAPIIPFVGVLPGRPELHPNPAEVERAFTVALVELMDPEVYREEMWTFADGSEVAMSFFELIGDTVWGATARMLVELLRVVTKS